LEHTIKGLELQVFFLPRSSGVLDHSVFPVFQAAVILVKDLDNREKSFATTSLLHWLECSCDSCV